METIKLKSSVNWSTHYLSSLKPVINHPDERWYKFITQYPYKIHKDEKTKLPNGISFHCGPVLLVGDVHPSIGMRLKEVCPCINNDDIDYVLIFDYDISSNKETGII